MALGAEERCNNTAQLGTASPQAEDMSRYSTAEAGIPEEPLP